MITKSKILRLQKDTRREISKRIKPNLPYQSTDLHLLEISRSRVIRF